MIRREPSPLGLVLILFFIVLYIIPTNLFFACLFLLGFAVVGAASFMAFVHPGYFHLTKRGAWEKFAKSNGLSFSGGNFFKAISVIGTYRGYHLEMDTYLKLDTSQIPPDCVPYTHLWLSSETSLDVPPSPVPQEDIKAMIGGLRLKNTLKGKVIARQGQQGVHYEQKGIEIDGYNFQLILQTLSEVAKVYFLLLALGGEIVPILTQVLSSEPGAKRLLATQLLYDIEQQTKVLTYLVPPPLCPHCLARYMTHEIHLPWQDTIINYCACRLCHKSRGFLKIRVIALLDRGMPSEQTLHEEELWINWLARRTLFDFDEVRIVEATDEDVERFAVQVGNDTDPGRTPEYKQIRCTVSPTCKLTENSLRILKRTFGAVEPGFLSAE